MIRCVLEDFLVLGRGRGCDFSAQIVGGSSLSGSVVACLLLSLCHQGLENGAVEDGCAASSRKLEPEDEDGLEGIVEGEVVEDDADGKRLDKVEEAKDDPVGEPLDVVVRAGALDGLEAQVGREGPADKVRGGRGKGVDEDEEGAEDGAAEGQGCLGDLGARLDVLEQRVARQLLVKLGIVVLCLVGSLDVDGVVGDALLLGGHGG